MLATALVEKIVVKAQGRGIIPGTLQMVRNTPPERESNIQAVKKLHSLAYKPWGSLNMIYMPRNKKKKIHSIYKPNALQIY